MLDVLIKGAEVVDGTGAPKESGDIGIRGGVIIARGQLNEDAPETLRVDTALAAPGWIDVWPRS